MTHKEMTEKSKNTILLGGLKLYGTRGYAGTSFSDLEDETSLTRGAFFHHYGKSINVFEATVNKYYFNRVTSCSVPEEYRSSLKGFLRSW